MDNGGETRCIYSHQRKREEGEICLILALSDLKTPLSQKSKQPSTQRASKIKNREMNLSFFFHSTLSQLPLTFFTTQLKSTSTRTVLPACHHQTNFQLFYNYCPTFFCFALKPSLVVNGSSNFSDTFLVKCSQLLSSFETPPFFCLEYFFIHTTLIWPWTRKKSFLYLKYLGTIVESILNELF